LSSRLSFNVVVSEDFIQRVIGFLEQADSFLLFRSSCYEMRFSIQQFIRAARDFVTLIDEAEPEPSKTKYANIFWEHQNRGEFLYLVDTMRDCEWGLQTSVRISFEKAVLRRVMFSMIITANGVIHSANGIGLYKEPYRYISTDDGVPFITEQPYPGLEQNRQNLLPHFRSL
jgi:hypothetical protein